MIPKQALFAIAVTAGVGIAVPLLAQPDIESASRTVDAAPMHGDATRERKTGARLTKSDTSSGTEPLERLVIRIENRVRNRIENRVDRTYGPQANPVASYGEADRRTRVVAPARRGR